MSDVRKSPLTERVSALEVELAELRNAIATRLILLEERLPGSGGGTCAPSSRDVDGKGRDCTPPDSPVSVGAWVFALPDVGGWEYGQVMSMDNRAVVVHCGRHGVIAVPNVAGRIVVTREGLGR